MTFAWNPETYRQFDDERSRPFHELLARVGATTPRRVVDVGCGPGHLTATLAQRWPDADVVGVDNSAEMLAAAEPSSHLSFSLGDAASWDPTGVDVIVSNATLQWVPDHAPVVSRWASALAPGGWIALQVPGNFDAPSHALMRSVATDFPAASAALRGADSVLSPAEYATLLLDAGLRADVWETTYVQVLDGEDPVLRWVRGTGLRPALAALASDPDAARAFEAAYADALRAAYPRRPDGTTLFPFRRLFAVGTRA